jgi:spore maturation protein CgeB
MSKTVLIIGGTQVTTSDLHLLYHRAFNALGWRSIFLSNDSHLPFGEKILQQSRLRFSRLHFKLFNARVRSVVREIRPQLVFISGSNWLLTPETVALIQRKYGARVALNEQHLQVFRAAQAECLPLYDHVFTQDSGLVALLRHASPAKSVSLLGPACDPRDHRPLVLTDDDRSALSADISYLGFAYQNRIDLFESLTGFATRLWGIGWERSEVLRPFYNPLPVHGLMKTRIYNATRISLNLQSVTYQLDGVTCRPFEVAACGGFCLCESRRDLAQYFKIGEEVIAFHDANDLKELIRYYLKHPLERTQIVAAARARVLAEHTYEHRAQQVLAEVGLG